MDMSVMAVDVLGTLRSPLILTLVLLYAAALAALTAASVVCWSRGGRSRVTAAVLFATLFLACAFNVAAVRAIAAVIIAVSNQAPGHIGVGFFGSYPGWLAPALGLVTGMLVSARIRRLKAAVV